VGGRRVGGATNERQPRVARKVVVQLTCDACDDEAGAAESVVLSYEGQDYGFELCANHLNEYQGSMRRWVQLGRPVDTVRASGGANGRAAARSSILDRRPARRDREQVGAIREWARANGHQVSDHGRIPRTIEDAYNRRSVSG